MHKFLIRLIRIFPDSPWYGRKNCRKRGSLRISWLGNWESSVSYPRAIRQIHPFATIGDRQEIVGEQKVSAV